MKLIEALKGIKEHQRKAEDLRSKIAKHSAYLDYETPVYKEQEKQVARWLQTHSDILKEILRLRIAIQRTNLQVEVVIEINGKSVNKSIAEWIHRRRDLATLEMEAWSKLTDKGLREGEMRQSTDNVQVVKLKRCYDPEERDINVDVYSNEPHLIDSRLEVVNAITDIIEK